MNRGIEALALTIALALVAACADTARQGEVVEEAPDTTMLTENPLEVRAAIEDANAAFSQAIADGDLAGAARGIFTEDARILPPGGEPVQGREAIVEFWAGAGEQSGITGVDLETLEVQTAGEGIAWEVGRFQIQGTDEPLDRGSYLVIWQNTPDGWKWHRDIWNSDGLVESETAPAEADTATATTG